jgi:hypothetical protein
LSNPKLEIELEAKGTSYHLIFGNPLSEATEREATERPSPQTNPPRYGAFSIRSKQTGGSQLLPFLMSHIDWNELNRDSSYFQVVAPSATSESATATP